MHTCYSYHLQFIGNGRRELIITLLYLIHINAVSLKGKVSLRRSPMTMGLSLCFSAGVVLYSLALFLYCWAQQGWRSSMHKRVLVATATAWHFVDTQGRRFDAFVCVCVCVADSEGKR